jgi:adenylate cyclase
VLARAQSDIRLENPESLFVTAFVAVLDLKSGYLEFVNAGHEPAWHRRPGERSERLSGPGGPPLCVLEEEFVYPISRLAMRPGEWLLVLSDGVTEATNPAGEFYGAQRLRESLDALEGSANAQDLASMVSENVRRFSAGAEPADDLTLLAIRWMGTPAAEG